MVDWAMLTVADDFHGQRSHFAEDRRPGLHNTWLAAPFVSAGPELRARISATDAACVAGGGSPSTLCHARAPRVLEFNVVCKCLMPIIPLLNG